MIGAVLDRALDDRLVSYVKQDQLGDLGGRLDQVEAIAKRLEGEIVSYRREVYTIKDLAKEMSLEVSTVRKNYICTGKIKATKTASGWEISREEYMRVVEVVRTRGLGWLQQAGVQS